MFMRHLANFIQKSQFPWGDFFPSREPAHATLLRWWCGQVCPSGANHNHDHGQSTLCTRHSVHVQKPQHISGLYQGIEALRLRFGLIEVELSIWSSINFSMYLIVHFLASGLLQPRSRQLGCVFFVVLWPCLVYVYLTQSQLN